MPRFFSLVYKMPRLRLSLFFAVVPECPDYFSLFFGLSFLSLSFVSNAQITFSLFVVCGQGVVDEGVPACVCQLMWWYEFLNLAFRF